MKIIKPLGDGIGTAAGVAWPTFGIIFGTLGLTIGASTTAIALGSVSGGLFVLVLLPITYWSYKNSKEEKEKLQQEIRDQKNQISEFLFAYLLSTLRRCLFNNKEKKINEIDKLILIKAIRKEILLDTTLNKNKYTPAIHQTLLCLLDDHQSNNLLYDFVDKSNRALTINYESTVNFKPDVCLKERLKNIYKKCDYFSLKPLDITTQVRTGVMSFTAGFGSIAGCSAGVSGLLMSIGVFAGLTAIPIAGWAILGAAVVFGLITAGISIYSAHEKDKKSQRLSHYKQINQDLSAIVVKNNIMLDAEIAAEKKYGRDLSKDSKYNIENKKATNNVNVNTAIRKPQSVNLGRVHIKHPIWSEQIPSRDTNVTTLQLSEKQTFPSNGS